MRSRKKQKQQITLQKGSRWLDCKVCGVNGEYCKYDIKAVICAQCVAQQAAPPETPKYLRHDETDEKRPRGWHLMKEYVSPSGKIYHKGREVNGESSSVDSTNVEGTKAVRPSTSVSTNKRKAVTRGNSTCRVGRKSNGVRTRK